MPASRRWTRKREDGRHSFAWVCANVHAVKDASIDPNELMGREYEENIFVHDPMRAIGQARALIESAGGAWGASIPQNLQAFKEAMPGITAGITHSKDKNDPDKVYGNFDMRSIKPVVKAPPPVGGSGALAGLGGEAPGYHGVAIRASHFSWTVRGLEG